MTKATTRAGECVFCGEVTNTIEHHHPNRRIDEKTTIPLCRECHQTYLKELAHKVANAGEGIDWSTDGLAYCEIGGHFTNICHRVTVRHGYCMDSPFCWATECEYNPDLDAETTEEIARALTDDMFGALIRGENIESDRTGEMALTDPDGNYWFEREQVVEELFALIESRKERDRFKDWYAAVKPLNIGSEVVNNSNTNSPERRNQRRLDDF